jgi:hypothetical protein
VQRRNFQLLGQLDAAGDQLGFDFVPLGPGRGQQTTAGGGGERHAALQLRVVVSAGAVPGVGPGVVEYVLALGVAFQIQRYGADHLGVPNSATLIGGALQGQVEGLPSGVCGDAAACLQSGEKGVAGKRILPSRAPVPVGGIDLIDPLNDSRLALLGHRGSRLTNGLLAPSVTNSPAA